MMVLLPAGAPIIPAVTKVLLEKEALEKETQEYMESVYIEATDKLHHGVQLIIDSILMALTIDHAVNMGRVKLFIRKEVFTSILLSIHNISYPLD